MLLSVCVYMPWPFLLAFLGFKRVRTSLRPFSSFAAPPHLRVLVTPKRAAGP